MVKNDEVLLKVDHLCQYFRLGRRDMKAVDDVSFEIKRGEAFGLVGESGCGKTTTGRSIIKLYNITSGSVYFKGQRISAGTRSYKDAIKSARDEAAKKIKALRAEKNADDTRKAEIKAEIEKINNELHEVVAKNRELIRDARVDSKEVDKKHSQALVKEIEAEYAGLFQAAEGDSEKLASLKKEYKNRLRVAKKSRLVTQIQMIFQDPIASLDPRMTVREIIAEGLVINGITDKEYINEKVYEILETVGLVREHADRYPHEFSGGQRQRIGIARAVIMQPEMIIAEGLVVNGITDKEYINNKVYEMLELVGLVREHADRYPHEFSGGQRQRIGIARAVIMQPEMIIADEPVSALDVSIQAQVINLLNDLRQRLGLTVLFIAHDLSVVKYFSDRIGVMYFGKLVELASSDELFKHPLHPYTKSLLSAIPLPDPIYEKNHVRITYNPIAEHDYSTDKPSLREIAPGHFVYCNDAEEEKYKQIVNNETEG